ncbi:hypothetical protein SEA_OUTIS_31 [Gordonia phage Outis]|nr:hypothetical protein SEA_STARSTRUCK_31 [Gordonia phage StarStruck]WKW85004.1 hypothetical protein SEA_OUTIS_31 [Gordonia phage Outis]
MAKLKSYVWLEDPNGDVPGTLVSFGPEDTLPEWAEKKLEGKKHLFEASDAIADSAVDIPLVKDQKPAGELDYKATGETVGREPAATEKGKTQLEDRDGDDEGETESDEPPKGNASKEAWALFAGGNGVPVAKGMSRDDIKAACIEAGVYTPPE